MRSHAAMVSIRGVTGGRQSEHLEQHTQVVSQIPPLRWTTWRSRDHLRTQDKKVGFASAAFTIAPALDAIDVYRRGHAHVQGASMAAPSIIRIQPPEK